MATPRLSLELTPQIRREVQGMEEDSRLGIAELVPLSLDLLRVVWEETRKGNKIIVTTEGGEPLKELVFPSLFKE